jgi:hypothetical protein
MDDLHLPQTGLRLPAVAPTEVIAVFNGQPRGTDDLEFIVAWVRFTQRKNCYLVPKGR